MRSRRITIFDSMKGMAILSVIAIHCSGVLGGYGFMSFYEQIGVVIRQFLNFAVPVFLFISGYLSYKRNDGIYYGMRRRIVRILSPFLFWSFIYTLFKIVTSHQKPDLLSILKDVATGNSIVVGYFVIVLLQFTILTPFINIIKSRTIHIAIISMTTLVGIIYTYTIQVLYQEYFISQFPYYALPFIVWYPFYHLGIYSNKYMIKTNFKYCAITSILLLTMSIAEGFYLYNTFGYAFAVSQVKLSSVLFSVSVCMLMISIIDRVIKVRLYNVIGELSYPIYLTHILFMWIILKIFKVLHITDNPLVLFSISFFMTSITAITFCYICKVIIPKWIFAKIMG